MIEGILRFGAKNSVFVNMLFWVICVAGILSWNYLPKEQFPRVQVDRVVAGVVWPGASTEDIEDLLLRPMEDAIDDVGGVKHIYSDAYRNQALVTIQFHRDTDVEKARSDIDRNLQELSLPEDASNPLSLVIKLNIPVISVALQGDTQALDLAEELSDELNELSGIQSVSMSAQSTPLLRVDLQPEHTKIHGWSTTDVANLLRASNQSAPLGSIAGQEGEQRYRLPRQNQGHPSRQLFHYPKQKNNISNI